MIYVLHAQLMRFYWCSANIKPLPCLVFYRKLYILSLRCNDHSQNTNHKPLIYQYFCLCTHCYTIFNFSMHTNCEVFAQVLIDHNSVWQGWNGCAELKAWSKHNYGGRVQSWKFKNCFIPNHRLKNGKFQDISKHITTARVKAGEWLH